MSYQAYHNEVEIQSVLILDENDEPIIDLTTAYADGKLSLDYIVFTESLSSPMMDGSLVFDGTQGDYEFMQLVGNETLLITMKTPDTETTKSESIQLPKFSVVSFQDSSNFSETNKTPEGFTTRKVTIQFCSTDAKKLFETPDLLPSGFIGKICSGITLDGSSGDASGGESEEDSDGASGGIDQRGLVEVIAESLDDGIDSEATLNDVWIKPHFISLPHRKQVEGMNTLQMLNYCKDYAVSGTNPNAVNYCFWQDIDGFHFKSIDLLAYESKQNETYKTFSLDSNMIGKNRIYRFDVISDFSFSSSLSNGALYSYYYRYEPDYYSSPYARLMDDREKFTKEKVVYNYKDVFNKLYGVEDGDPFPFVTKEQLEDLENDELSANDVLFGYQSDRAFNDQDKIRSVLLMGNERIAASGPSGPSGDSSEDGEGGEGLFSVVSGVSGPSGDLPDNLSHFNAYETNKWQAMFDCMDLDGEPLKKIVNEIKLPTFKAKKEYRDKLAYKEQWNIYKYSVCCTSPQVEDSGFMAVVKDTRLVGRNIWRYSWNEVIFIPKVELANFAGATGPTADYSLSVEDLNRIELTAGSNWDNLTISKYGVEVDTPFTVGDLSGEIRIQGTTCGITFENENSVTRVLETYLQCDIEGTTSGVTLAFHNDEWSPFLVVEKPNGARGSTTDYSGAYNLNEVLNRATYNDFTYPDIAGTCGGSVLHYQDFNSAGGNLPGVSAEVDILIGPGINANKEHTDYPLGFASMPVGSYQRLNTDDNGNAQTGVQCLEIPMGHVVKIQAIKTKDLPLYGININSPDIKTVYYFNATNAQDGDCNTTSDCPIGDNRS